VTIFLFCGWLIIVLTIFPVYVMLIASGERIIMGVGWFKSMDVRSEWQRNHEKDFYWFEVQLLLTTVFTIFLPIILIIACNIRILTIGNDT
jgi:4-amino-4-deoxy-L-arabinose transferase-like glycosyltransferase